MRVVIEDLLEWLRRPCHRPKRSAEPLLQLRYVARLVDVPLVLRAVAQHVEAEAHGELADVLQHGTLWRERLRIDRLEVEHLLKRSRDTPVSRKSIV